jgi:hypothetical protein
MIYDGLFLMGVNKRKQEDLIDVGDFIIGGWKTKMGLHEVVLCRIQKIMGVQVWTACNGN